MTMQRPKILLSEGSSLSAREAITVLGLAGHRVELVSAEALCLGRFSRFVSRVHPAPASGADPDGYLATVLDVVKRGAIDALVPVHEQAYLFAAARRRLPADLGIAVSDFASFEQVQSKSGLAELLTRLGLPQPASSLVRSAEEFARPRPYPYFVKAAFGTASVGVWRIGDERARDILLTRLAQETSFADDLLIQTAVAGTLERTQAVFDHGRLVACHIYQQVAEGPGGGDVIKLSVVSDQVRDIIGRIGAVLCWHGALSLDHIRDDASGTPYVIDANPRLVEPMNAWLSGVDLPGALLRISLGENPPVQPEGRAGVRTRLGLMGLMDAARRRHRRRDVLNEMILLASNSGRYRATQEELVPLWSDPCCAIPVAVVAASLLRAPRATGALSEKTVAAYSLTPRAIHRLHAWQHSD